jgi:hypothetical protein
MSRFHRVPRACLRPIAGCLGSLLLGLPGLAFAGGDLIFRSGFEAAGGPFIDAAQTGSDPVLRSWSSGGSRRTAVLYAGGGSGGSDAPVRYGECAGDCGTADQWRFTTLGSYGSPGLGGGARLALDPGGHPRAIWYSQASVGGNGTLFYGECDAGDCGTSAAWTIRPILTFTGGDSMALLARGAFALDPQGRPRVLLQDLGSGTYYGQCNAACTQGSNWSFNQFLQISALADLAFTASGQPRVAYEAVSPNVIDGEDLYYAACDANCTSEDNWQSVVLLPVNDNLVSEPFSLALDASGAPRLAFYYAAASNRQLAYAWCDASCSTGGQGTWSAYATGLPDWSGRKGVSLALDDAGEPHLAFGTSSDGTSDEGVDVADCIQDCGSQPVWQWRTVARAQDVELPPPDPCDTGLSFWQLGTTPALARDGGGARLAYDTYAYFSCITGYDQNGNPIYTVSTYPGPVGYAEP